LAARGEGRRRKVVGLVVAVRHRVGRRVKTASSAGE
jgi:hypothetical protein